MSATIANDGVAGTSTAATSSTLSVTGTAGNAMILAAALGTKTRTLASVTDSASNSGWVVLTGAGSSSGGNCWLAWNPNLTSGITSVTLTFGGGTSRVSMGWMDVSGLTGVVDGTPASSDNTTASSAPAISITTTNADDFIVAALGLAASATLNSIDSPFAQEVNATGQGGGLLLIIPATTEQVSTGTYTCTWRLAAALVNTTAIAAFKVAGGGGGPALRELMLTGVGS